MGRKVTNIYPATRPTTRSMTKKGITSVTPAPVTILHEELVTDDNMGQESKPDKANHESVPGCLNESAVAVLDVPLVGLSDFDDPGAVDFNDNGVPMMTESDACEFLSGESGNYKLPGTNGGMETAVVDALNEQDVPPLQMAKTGVVNDVWFSTEHCGTALTPAGQTESAGLPHNSEPYESKGNEYYWPWWDPPEASFPELNEMDVLPEIDNSWNDILDSILFDAMNSQFKPACQTTEQLDQSQTAQQTGKPDLLMEGPSDNKN